MSKEDQLVSQIFRQLYFAILQFSCCKFLKNQVSLWLKNKITKVNHLSSVDSSLYVFRLTRPSKDFEEKKTLLPISVDAFIMSTKDKEGTPPHLSVWVEGYTTPSEAYAFLIKPESPDKVICWLNVGAVRGICSNVDGETHNNFLDVLWINIADLRLGAEGHAGITGLNPKDKLLRKDLRFKLAEIANKNVNDVSRQHKVNL